MSKPVTKTIIATAKYYSGTTVATISCSFSLLTDKVRSHGGAKGTDISKDKCEDSLLADDVMLYISAFKHKS